MTFFHSHSPEETTGIGHAFAATLKNGDVVAFSGGLGTGKTHFIKGVCDGLGVRTHVASPTFTFINEYPAGERTVVHIDLYRVQSPRELAELGVGEYFNERSICLIEWADRMAGALPEPHIDVQLSFGEAENDRVITVSRVLQAVRSAGV
jgi:tRNA threonylcarbamoyladenosine biosynthesis protein TsaE